jgi:N-acetylmuramoyl-L-alanine amidase
MRVIKYIVIHCTATQPHASIEAIRNYWKNTLGWIQVGYHYIIDRNGNITQLADESVPTNGVAGYNANSIHISYIGGIDSNGSPKDTRTALQRINLLELITEVKKRYPEAIIQGHRDFKGVKKACPSFEVKEEYSNL